MTPDHENSKIDPAQILTIDQSLQRLDGDQDLLLRLFELFMDNAPQKLAAIDQSITLADWQQLKNLAHALKGAAATVGAWQIQETAFALEQGAQEEDVYKIQAQHKQLVVLYAQTLEAMRTFIAQDSLS